jgi:hypothetical protein
MTDENPVDLYVRLLTRGSARPVSFGAPEDDPMAGVIKAITDNVLAHVASASRDPELSEKLRPDLVVVRTMPPAPAQAVTVAVGPLHLVMFNRGLGLFLYRLARAFAGNYIVRGPQDPPAPPEEEAVGRIATLLDWMASPARAPLIDDWEVGPREVRTAENFTTAAEQFVMCHEIAHIMHGHVASGDSAELEELDTRPDEQETAADVTAAILTVEAAHHSGSDPRAAVVGMHYLFKALHLAEQVGALTSNSSHLPALQRLELCYFALHDYFAQAAPALSVGVPEVDALLARLGPAALRERESRRAETAAWMDELFRITPWRPDEDLLNQVMAKLTVSPSAVIEALQANLLDAETYLTHLGDDESDELRRHQLAHFFARYAPDQVRDVLGVTFIPFTRSEDDDGQGDQVHR